MATRPLLIVVDAYTKPDGLFPARDGPPPTVRTLRALDRLETESFAAPAILCDETTAARARGALLVTNDQDGTAIVLPKGLSVDALAKIAAAHAWTVDPTSRIRLVEAGGDPASGCALEPARLCDQLAFHDSQLNGCRIPSEWLLLAVVEGG